MNGLPERCLLDTNAVVSLLRGHGELLALTKDACLVTADRQLLALENQVEALHTLAFTA